MDGVDYEARQKATKITVTGIELAAIEGDFLEAGRTVRRYTEQTKDGGGSLRDLAALASHYAIAEASATALYRLTGTATWRNRAETARSGRSAVLLALSTRERELAGKVAEFDRFQAVAAHAAAEHVLATGQA